MIQPLSYKVNGWRQCTNTFSCSSGSCKLGLYCTSSMEVKRTDNDVIHVSLYTDHRGHELGFPSLVHTTSTKSERERIAGNVIIQFITYLESCAKCCINSRNKEL